MAVVVVGAAMAAFGDMPARVSDAALAATTVPSFTASFIVLSSLVAPVGVRER
jgi:hypothetical protein